MKKLLMLCLLAVSSNAFAAPPTAKNAPATATPKPAAAGTAATEKKVSLLFMVTANSAIVKKGAAGLELSMPVNSNIVVFTDRPYRLARALPGGLKSFATFFDRSNFKKDLPNVTFSGSVGTNNKQAVTILEMSQPTVKDGNFVMKITRAIGNEQLPPEGTYSNVSLVVDSVWDWVEAGAACSVGEAVTEGLDTALCVGAVANAVGNSGN